MINWYLQSLTFDEIDIMIYQPWRFDLFIEADGWWYNISWVDKSWCQSILWIHLFIIIYYTPLNEVQRVYINHFVCPSVRLSVQICVRPITCYWFHIYSSYFAHGCITMIWCIAYISDPDSILNFDLKVKYIWFRTCFGVRPITFLDWHGLTIFGTWVYHHKTMCRVNSWSRIDVDLWPQGQIYRLLSCLYVQAVTSVSFDIGIPNLTHGSITKRGCVKYIHDPVMTLTSRSNL